MKDERFEVLYDMLKEQMALLKRIQIEQAKYSNSLIQKMSDRLERLENKQYVEQADLLKLQRGLENHKNSINETRNFNEQTGKTLDNLKEKVKCLEAVEEQFVDVHARLLANAYYEFKSEIVKEMSSTSNTLSIKTGPREDPPEQSRPRSSTEAVAPPKQNICSYEHQSVATRNAERRP